MTRVGMFREEEVWPFKWIWMKEGRGAQEIQFPYFLMATSCLLAELIEEERGMDVAKSASSPGAFYWP